MAFPLLFPACAWVAGTWVSSAVGVSAGSWLEMALACLAAAWVSFFLSTPKAALVYLLAAAFFMGAAAPAIAGARYGSNPVRRLVPGGYVDFTGRLSRSPARGPDRDYLFLRLESLETGGRKRTLSGNLEVSVALGTAGPGRIRLLRGDRVRVGARITAPSAYNNFGARPASESQRNRNVHNLAFSKSSRLVQRLGPPGGFSLGRLLSRVRRSFQDRIEEYFSRPGGGALTPAGAVLEALLLGERRRMDEETGRNFQESGLLHLIAISGAHVAIISALLLGLFRLVRLSPRLSDLLLIGALVGYCGLVEAAPSALRATTMAVCFLTGRLIWRQSHPLNALAGSALALLVLNPLSLFETGFELTYAATLAIILFLPRLVGLLPRLPFKIGETFALSTAAQAGVMPIAAGAFNRIALAPLLLNLAAVPIVGLIMAGGYLFLVLAWVGPTLGLPLAGALRALAAVLLRIARLSDLTGVLSFRVPDPLPAAVLGYYAFLLWLLRPGRRRRSTGLKLAGLAACALLVAAAPRAGRTDRLKVTFLDVGQGDSILVELPGRMKILVDGGGSSVGTFDPGERVVSDFLWRKGIRRLDLMVATHPHPDHIKGLVAVARNFRPPELWEGPSPEENVLARRLRAALPARTVRRRVSRGFAREESGVRLDVLHPGADAPAAEDRANDNSVVIRVSLGRTAFLLTGDIGLPSEEEIMASGPELRSGVLKAGHHGSDSSSGPEFLVRVRPRVAVITAGRNNAYGLPKRETLARLRAAGSAVYRTDRDGAVEVTSTGLSYAVRCSREPDLVRVFRPPALSSFSTEPGAGAICPAGPGSGARNRRHN
jgi:competence protein ComEC